MHAAVVKGGKCAEELVKILQNHGADPSIRNHNINQDEEEEEDRSLVSLDFFLQNVLYLQAYEEQLINIIFRKKI